MPIRTLKAYIHQLVNCSEGARMQQVIGRPRGGSDARARLIAAALSLFGDRGYRKVSTRELAREAEVDAALIRYYFGSKSGLFKQMLRETMAPVLEQFRALSVGRTPEDIAGLMDVYYRVIAPNPRLPRLVMHILHEGEESEPHQIVLELFQEIIELGRRWFGEVLANSGHLNEEVDPDLARLSFVSLMVFPMIAPPVLVKQFGVTHDPTVLSSLARHNESVLKRGLFRLKPGNEA